MDNTETFHDQKMVVAGTVGFSFEADLFKSGPIIKGFGCNGQHSGVSQKQRLVVAETVGFLFEADFCRSVPTILGFGCHGQH